ncbi:hypothetical protein FOPG_20214 [Fusarium oxysporum f. sp. conglutinans race 2 54008]|uniref:Uncharacterized protein n=1 Tax=Fusarium oxysporum f. sp. conglutinans race 2 54008 TaxID=1089457 RepID=X0GIP7_FUSOX|nr:hypothetical protein FOPG_20214 [Fusarium oxysporum f. sp. conglutinans race 2 54008]
MDQSRPSTIRNSSVGLTLLIWTHTLSLLWVTLYMNPSRPTTCELRRRLW